MTTCEDTFYGFIVSGLSPKTSQSFTCTNSTFRSCVRTNTPSSSFSDPDTDLCTDATSFNRYCQTSTHLSFTSSAIFDNCKFIECISSSGGAVFITDATCDAELYSCFFDHCSSTTDTASDPDLTGGALHFSKIQSVLCSDLSFISCSATTDAYDVDNMKGPSCYGGAIYAVQLSSFVLTDSSFVDCFIKPNITTDSSSQPKTIIGATGSGGGAYLSTIPLAQVISCSFQRCYTQPRQKDHGGGLSADIITSAFTLTNTAFTNCKNLCAASNGDYRGSGGGLFVNNFRVESPIQYCVCTNCTTTGEGGGMRVQSPTHSPDFLIHSCIYTGCVASNKEYTTNKAGGRGGGLFLVSSSRQQKIFNCTFLYCKAATNGGGFGWTLTKADVTAIVDTCVFGYCEASAGADAYFHNHNLPTNPFKDCYTYTLSENRVSIPSGSKLDYSNLPQLLGVSAARYIRTSAPDLASLEDTDKILGDNCTSKEYSQCVTISMVYDKASEFKQFRHAFFLPDNEEPTTHHCTQDCALQIDDGTFHLTTSEESRTDIIYSVPSLTAPLFIVQTASSDDGTAHYPACLELNHFVIELASSLTSHLIENHAGATRITDMAFRTPADNSHTHATALILVTGGVLETSQSCFSNLLFSSDPLVSLPIQTHALSNLPAPSLSFLITEFNNITRASGNGAVIDLSTQTGSLITQSVDFIDCKCTDSDACAGPIFIQVMASSFKLTNLTFTGCSYGSDDANEMHIFIQVDEYNDENQLRQAEWRDIWANFTEASGNKELYKIKIGSSEAQPILHFVFHPGDAETDETVMHLNPAQGYTFESCGWDTLPCKSLTQAYSLKGKLLSFAVDAAGEFTSFNEAPDNSMDIGTLGVSFSFTDADGDTHFLSHPNIKLDLQDCDTDIFRVSSGSLNCSHLNFTLASTLSDSASFCSINNAVGKVILTSIAITASTTSAFPSSLFNCVQGSYEFTNTIISNFHTSQPLLSISAASGLSFANALFESITRTEGNGAVIDISSSSYPSSSFTLSGFSCTSCSTESGQGGAVSIAVPSSSSLSLSDLSFSSCSASKGYGGALVIELAETTSTLSLSSLSFSSAGSTKDSVGKYVHFILHSTAFLSLDTQPTWISTSLLTGASYEADAGTDDDDHSKLYSVSIQNENTQLYFAPLLYLKYSPSDANMKEMVIAADGIDTKTCGWSSLPCQSLSTAYSQYPSTQSLTLGEGTFTALESGLVLTSSIELTGQSGNTFHLVAKLTGENKDSLFDISAPATTHTSNEGEETVVITSLGFLYLSEGPALVTLHASFEVSLVDVSISIWKDSDQPTTRALLTSSLITATDGHLNLEGFTVTSISSSTALITATGANVTIKAHQKGTEKKQSSFTAPGRLLDVVTPAGGVFSVTDTTFVRDCESGSTNANSDAESNHALISLHFPSTPSVFAMTQVTLPSETCASSSSSNGDDEVASSPLILSIKFSGEPTFLTKESFTGTISSYASMKSLSHLLQVEEVVSAEQPARQLHAPLLYFLFAPTEGGDDVDGLFVDNKGLAGADIATCGWSDLPCKTMEYALTTRGTLTLVTLRSADTITKQYSLPSSSSLSLKPEEEVDVLSIAVASFTPSAGNAAVLTNAGTLSLRFISFNLPSTTTSSSSHANTETLTTFLTSSSSLTLTTVTFASSSPVSLTLLSITNGKLTGNNLTTEITSFIGGSPIILYSSLITATISNLTVADAGTSTTNSFVTLQSSSSTSSSSPIAHTNAEDAEDEISSVPTITFHNCTFTSISTSGTSPSVLSSSSFIVSTLSFLDCNFSSCVSSQSIRGGALYSTLGDGGKLTVAGCNTQNCKCTADDSKGGFLYLETDNESHSDAFNSSPLPLLIRQITFDGNSASCGKDIFINCKDPSTQITSDLFIIPFPEEKADDNYGYSFCTNSDACTDFVVDIAIYRSTEIYVKASDDPDAASSSASCGSEDSPCPNILTGTRHLLPDDAAKLFITSGVAFGGEVRLFMVTLQSRDATQVSVKLEEDMTPIGADSSAHSFISISEKVQVINVTFVIAGTFVPGHSALFGLASGSSFTLTECCFKPNDDAVSPASLSYSLIALPSDSVEETLSTLTPGLVLKKSNFTHLSFSNNGLLHSTSDSSFPVTITGCLFESLSSSTQAPLLLAFSSTSDSCALTIEGTKFHSLSSDLKQGAVLTLAGNADIKDCSFDGLIPSSSPPPSSRRSSLTLLSNEETSMCEWSGSLVSITSGAVTFTQTSFANATAGALSIAGEDTEVTINNWDFQHNGPENQDYPDLSRNLLCKEDATVAINSLKSGDITSQTSLWILQDSTACTVVFPSSLPSSSQPASFLFVPSLVSADGKWDDTLTELAVSVTGLNLFPCSLAPFITFSDKSTTTAPPLTYSTQTSLSLSLSTQDFPVLSEDSATTIALRFGAEKMTEAITISITEEEGGEQEGGGGEEEEEGPKKSQSASPKSPIPYTVGGGIGLLLIILLVIVVICCCCRKKKQEQKKKQTNITVLLEDRVVAEKKETVDECLSENETNEDDDSPSHSSSHPEESRSLKNNAREEEECESILINLESPTPARSTSRAGHSQSQEPLLSSEDVEEEEINEQVKSTEEKEKRKEGEEANKSSA